MFFALTFLLFLPSASTSLAQHVVGNGGDGCAASFKYIARGLAKYTLSDREIQKRLGSDELKRFQHLATSPQAIQISVVPDTWVIDPRTNFNVPVKNDGKSSITLSKTWCDGNFSIEKQVEVFHEILCLMGLESSQNYAISSILYQKLSSPFQLLKPGIKSISCEKHEIFKSDTAVTPAVEKQEAGFIQHHFETRQGSLNQPFSRVDKNRINYMSITSVDEIRYSIQPKYSAQDQSAAIEVVFARQLHGVTIEKRKVIIPLVEQKRVYPLYSDSRFEVKLKCIGIK